MSGFWKEEGLCGMVLVSSRVEHVQGSYRCAVYQHQCSACGTYHLPRTKWHKIIFHGCFKEERQTCWTHAIMLEVLLVFNTRSPTVGESERLQKQRRPILNTLRLDVKGGRSLESASLSSLLFSFSVWSIRCRRLTVFPNYQMKSPRVELDQLSRLAKFFDDIVR